jgi:hypothetical protein
VVTRILLLLLMKVSFTLGAEVVVVNWATLTLSLCLRMRMVALSSLNLS